MSVFTMAYHIIHNKSLFMYEKKQHEITNEKKSYKLQPDM